MRKTRQSSSVPLSVKLPPKKIREKFHIFYELDGCQKASDFLTKYYGVRRMRIILDGRRVPKRCCGLYFKNRAYFTREGLKKTVVLHELYHHLVEAKGYELRNRIEEKEANNFAGRFQQK